MRLSIYLLIFMLQLPYGADLMLGSDFFENRKLTTSILEKGLELVEEIEEKEKEIE